MPTVPLWLIGRTVTAVIVTPQTADADGVLTPGSGVSFTAVVDEIGYSGRVTTAEISALTASRRNEVPIEEDHTLTLTEIMRNGAALSLGCLVWTGAPDRASFYFSRGGNSILVYGVLSDYSETVTKTRSMATLTIRFTDTPGTTNPAYGAASVG
jgi:hypothetical protein